MAANHDVIPSTLCKWQQPSKRKLGTTASAIHRFGCHGPFAVSLALCTLRLSQTEVVQTIERRYRSYLGVVGGWQGGDYKRVILRDGTGKIKRTAFNKPVINLIRKYSLYYRTIALYLPI
jgi:hypothetical protein